MSIRWQEIAGALVAAAGVIWGSYTLTQNFTPTTLVSVPPRGPLEVCAAGVLLWLVAKWRRSVKVR
jgi:hypothetical protein